MEDKIVVVFNPSPSTQELEILTLGLSLEAKLKKNQKPVIPYAYFLKNTQGVILGGINGCVLYGYLTIDQLWIEESLRGNDFGKELMQLAENFGISHQCRYASVNTMDWEAKDFYIKLGYQIEFQREGYDNSSIFYFLKKTLSIPFTKAGT